MAINSFETLQNKLSRVNVDEMYATICSNIKKYRLEKYNEFKSKNSQSTINPYSTENVAALLDYNHNHYTSQRADILRLRNIPQSMR